MQNNSEDQRKQHNIIKKELISKDKKEAILWLIIILILSFILTNTHSMFFLGEDSLTAEDLIRRYFSLSPFKTCILFFIYGLFVVFLLRDKEQLFNEIYENRCDFKEVFFTKYLSVVSVISFNSIMILLLKLIAFFINRDLFIKNFIGIGSLLLFFIVFTLVSILSASLAFLSMFIIKNNLLALTLFPMIGYFIFLFFGVFKELISSYLWPIKYVLDKISIFLVDYFVFFIAFDWRVELQGIGFKLVSILFYFFVDIILFILSYKAMERINGEIINREYYFLWIRKFINVILSFIGGLTIFVFLYLLVLTVSPESFQKISLGINIFAVILSILLYRVIERKHISNECD